METNEELIKELNAAARAIEDDDEDISRLIARAADVLESATTETEWQYSYVEKWSDGSGIYGRETFKTKGEALECLTENVASVSGFNSEQTEPGDQLVALVERRQVSLPGPWLPVEGEAE
jgi:hypothetical protein